MPRPGQPANSPTVSPYLTVPDAAALLDWIQQVFECDPPQEVIRDAQGTINHAEIRIGDSVIMVGQPPAEAPMTSTMLYVYVPDCDATYARALAAGATADRPVADQPYGDRNGGVKDAFGNSWWMATHQKVVPTDAIQAHYDAQAAAS